MTQRKALCVLSGKQRDFLASYPNEVEVKILAQNDEGDVQVYANGDLHESNRELWVPREGFLTQPTVELHDWEVDLNQLPEKEQ